METERSRYGFVINEAPSQVVQRWDIPRPLWYLGAALVVVVLAVGAWVVMGSSSTPTTAAPTTVEQAAPVSEAEAVTTLTEPRGAIAPTARPARTTGPTTAGAAAAPAALAAPVESGGGPEPLTASSEAVPDDEVLPAAVPALGAGGGAAGP